MVPSLVHITLCNLSNTYLNLLNDIEVNGVRNGIILTNVGDTISKLRGDIKTFHLLYIITLSSAEIVNTAVLYDRFICQ